MENFFARKQLFYHGGAEIPWKTSTLFFFFPWGFLCVSAFVQSPFEPYRH